jgi:hypothetical protein
MEAITMYQITWHPIPYDSVNTNYTGCMTIKHQVHGSHDRDSRVCHNLSMDLLAVNLKFIRIKVQESHEEKWSSHHYMIKPRVQE